MGVGIEEKYMEGEKEKGEGGGGGGRDPLLRLYHGFSQRVTALNPVQ